jgi:hypothetical protein
MSHYKIKLEDKAAFLNALEKQNVEIDSFEIKTNKLKGYFEFDVDNPEVNNLIRDILKTTPKIKTIKETIRQIVREELKRK